MFRLKRLFSKKKVTGDIDLDDDQGAIAIAVALIFASGFFVVIFALVFDIGSLYAERRVVQNAAEFSAQALAIQCAETAGIPNTTCEQNTKSSAEILVREYANLNSPDGQTTANLCGRGAFGSCPVQEPSPFVCSEVNSSTYPNWLRVMSDTKTPTSDFISPVFTSIIDPNVQADVKGCANSAWGKSDFAPVVLPIGLPICNYQLTGEQPISSFKTSSSNLPCTIIDLLGKSFRYELAGVGPPNGFATFVKYGPTGALVNDIGCANLSQGSRLNIGNRIRFTPDLQEVYRSCGGKEPFFSRLRNLIDSKQVVFVPALGVALGGGSGTWEFEIVAFFAFKLEAYRFSNSDLFPSSFNWPPNCNTSSIQCLFGDFVTAVVPGAIISTTPGPSVGAQAVQLLP